MTKEFNNQGRGDQRPHPRDSFLRRFGLSRPARSGLNRDMEDRTRKKGARQNPADYLTDNESNSQPRDKRRPRNPIERGFRNKEPDSTTPVSDAKQFKREGVFRNTERVFRNKETDGTTPVSDAKQVKTRIPSASREHFAIITPKGLAIENKTDGSGELKYIYTGKIPVKDVKWSPGKQKSLAYLLANGDVNVYNLPKDTTIPLSGHTAPVTALAWSPDGKYIASGSDDTTVQIWDATDGSNIVTYLGHTAPVTALAWSPDGKYIASGSDDTTVQVWDATNGSNVVTYRGHTALVTALAWSPNGTRIASGSDDTTVQVWDATDGRNVVTYPEHTAPVTALAWLPDGTGIASISSDRIMRMWNAISKEPISTDNAIEKTLLVWSPDGKYVATAELENTVRVTERETGHEFRYRGHTALVTALAWSPDGKYIASGSDDNTVRVWQVPPPD